MFRSVLKKALAAAAFAALASAANAAVVSLKLSETGFADVVVNGTTSISAGSTNTSAFGSNLGGTDTYFVGNFGTFNEVILQGFATPLSVSINFPPPGSGTEGLLDTFSSATSTSAGGTLTLLATAQDLNPADVVVSPPSYSNLTFVSSFAAGGQHYGNVTITETTFIDPANGQFTTLPHQLGSATFSAPGTGTQNAAFIPLSAPYSVTEEFVIAAIGAAEDEAEINLSGSVPEPSTWAMMLLGFAGLGFAFHRSRRTVARSPSQRAAELICFSQGLACKAAPWWTR
jgi:hypothetical protein